MAMHLHKRYNYSLIYVRGVGVDGMRNTDIFHVVVQISEDDYLNITGHHTKDQLIQKYQEELGTCIYITNNFEELDYQYRAKFPIDTVADRLVELYLQ